jgi:hypothetical protein
MTITFSKPCAVFTHGEILNKKFKENNPCFTYQIQNVTPETMEG